MPIEIKELHIRVAVNAGTEQPAAGQIAGRGGRADGDEEVSNAIVAECVEQVLQILQNKAER